MFDDHQRISLNNNINKKPNSLENYDDQSNYYNNDDDYFNEEDEYRYLEEEEEVDEDILESKENQDNNISLQNKLRQLPIQESIDDIVSDYAIMDKKPYFTKQESILEEDETELKSPDNRGADLGDKTQMNKTDDFSKKDILGIITDGGIEKKPDTAPKKSGVTAKERWHWAYNKIIIQLNVSFVFASECELKFYLFYFSIYLHILLDQTTL